MMAKSKTDVINTIDSNSITLSNSVRWKQTWFWEVYGSKYKQTGFRQVYGSKSNKDLQRAYQELKKRRTL